MLKSNAESLKGDKKMEALKFLKEVIKQRFTLHNDIGRKTVMIQNPDSSLKNLFCMQKIYQTFPPISEIDSTEHNPYDHVIEIAVNVDKK